jgi:phenylalanyl-tRNA synthetase beta chain
MRVSLNQIKQFIDFELPPVDELVKRINEQLGGVEEVIDLGARYKDALIAKVVKCDKHPDADKLSVCEIDAGTGENIQVVCGAPNVRDGLFVVWLPPESVVPSTYGDKEPFVLEPKELRGVVSHGMLASAKELGIGDDHSGIVELNPDEWKPHDIEVKPGASFAEAYGLDGVVIDIENKMFTHRPDLFGQLGVAREIAGIYGHQFDDPEWYWSLPQFEQASGLDLEVFNEAKDKVPRFMAVTMKNIEVKPSPLWLQCALVAMGSKPINNIVDVTNYVMLLTAQPTHAYDYDKLRGHKLGARMAKKGEKAELLNGKTYELDESDIVIVDGEGVVGLGGIMGGGNSEVSSETKGIVLEVANFDMYTVRRSSMRHGLFTDALTRFNKGQSPLQNDRILNLLMMSIKDVSAEAEQAGDVSDLHDDQLGRAKDEQSNSGTLKVEANFINDRLGLSLKEPEIEQLLRNVHFACYVEEGDAAISITAPFWRTDIELPEDIVEEVGRLYGFDKLPRELPMRSMAPTAKNDARELKQSLRDTLSRAGANEVLTYSFVHEKVLQNAGQDSSHAFKLSNALSPDLQYYRLSLMPSLLDKVHMNIKAGHDQFALFEIGKTHYKGEMDEIERDVPNEDSHIAFITAHVDKARPEGAAYYQAKRYAEKIVNLSDYAVTKLADFDTASDEWGAQLTAAYEPQRSAVIVKGGQIWGVIGEFKQSVVRSFKLPAHSAGFELHLDLFTSPEPLYESLSKYPSTMRDVSLEVSSGTTHEAVLASVKSGLGKLEGSDVKLAVSPISIYQGDDTSLKTITLQIKLTPVTDTLTSEHANELVTSTIDQVVAELGARIV